MPIDVVKVRLQYAGADGKKMYSGVLDAAQKTVKVSLPVHVWKRIATAVCHTQLFAFSFITLFYLKWGLSRRLKGPVPNVDNQFGLKCRPALAVEWQELDVVAASA